MRKPLHEEEAGFIQNLPATTGKTLEDWFDLITGSGKSGFLDIRQWLVDVRQLETRTATTLAQLFLEDQERHAPKLMYHQEGRGGDFRYESREGSFTSFWEFGGDDCIAILFVPTEQRWEAQTGIPLSKRTEVLQFIGERTVAYQTRGGKGRYEIEDNCIPIRN